MAAPGSFLGGVVAGTAGFYLLDPDAFKDEGELTAASPAPHFESAAHYHLSPGTLIKELQVRLPPLQQPDNEQVV